MVIMVSTEADCNSVPGSSLNSIMSYLTRMGKLAKGMRHAVEARNNGQALPLLRVSLVGGGLAGRGLDQGLGGYVVQKTYSSLGGPPRPPSCLPFGGAIGASA